MKLLLASLVAHFHCNIIGGNAFRFHKPTKLGTKMMKMSHMRIPRSFVMNIKDTNHLSFLSQKSYRNNFNKYRKQSTNLNKVKFDKDVTSLASIQSYSSSSLLSFSVSSNHCTSPIQEDAEDIESKNQDSDYIIMEELEWRQEAQNHAEKVFNILSPGMLPLEQSSQSSQSFNNRKTKRAHNEGINSFSWRGLDPYNPIYNFLIEYYGIRGAKGCRRLGRWSPPMSSNTSLSKSSVFNDKDPFTNKNAPIFLQGAKENDFGYGGILHLRGAYPIENKQKQHFNGFIYKPSLYISQKIQNREQNNENFNINTTNSNIGMFKYNDIKQKYATPYLWYYHVLSNTFTNPNPITHCFGLHEWAMLYHPLTSKLPPPPSAKYQKHLPRRVSQQIINDTVERKGVSCTHYDAIRFFAKDALPLLLSQPNTTPNQSSIKNNDEDQNVDDNALPVSRLDQVNLEQPACVHANMDLLKMALKISPFISSSIVTDALELAIASRKLDVAASPYDASSYGLDPVMIETVEGRRIYKETQIALMEKGQQVRQKLLIAYEEFLLHAFGEDVLSDIAILKSNNKNV